MPEQPTAPSVHTVAVSVARDPSPGAMLNPPIALVSNFRLTSETDYLPNYARTEGTATWQAFEQAVGALEGGRAVAFASGMAAVTAVLEQLPTGAHVVAPDTAYVGVREQLRERADRGRLTYVLLDMSDTAAVVAALDGADLVWAESPANPTLAETDLAAVGEAARAQGVPFVVDNTFATPVLQHPLAIGADFVVHSATKFIGGHSDLLLGVVVTADDGWHDRLVLTRTVYGGVPGALEAFLALRGLRTLPLRVERGQATAQVLAGRLAQHPAVVRVRYPGFGAMLSFDLADGDAADRACHAVRLIVHATSLGGVETTMERRHKYAGEAHVPPGLIRCSVGLEDPEDLWADLAAALDAALAAPGSPGRDCTPTAARG